MKLIEPRTLKGFRDFLPEQAIVRQRLLEKIVATFQSFGFLPLETPALEYADILTGKYGGEGEKLLYRFRDQGERDVALRYDLTVPLARVVAQYPELPKPFRRYQIAPVWRAENTQRGRFREFTQCDVDIVGTDSIAADAEVAQVLAAVLTKLGIKKFEIRLNNRKLLDGMLQIAGIKEELWTPVLRVLDKWEKIGDEAGRLELERAAPDGDFDAFFAMLPTAEEEDDATVWESRVRKTLLKSRQGTEGLNELQQLRGLLEAADLDTVCRFDVLLARGLDYYTGTVMEAVLTQKPDIGSVAGGGRYDGLIGRFTGKDMPAVGASVGIDRLIAAMEELTIVEKQSALTDAYLIPLENALLPELLALGAELRAVGIKTECAYDAEKLDKQLKYADRLGIPFAVIVGKKEKAEGTAVIRDLLERRQFTVRRGTLVAKLQGLVKGE